MQTSEGSCCWRISYYYSNLKKKRAIREGNSKTRVSAQLCCISKKCLDADRFYQLSACSLSFCSKSSYPFWQTVRWPQAWDNGRGVSSCWANLQGLSLEQTDFSARGLSQLPLSRAEHGDSRWTTAESGCRSDGWYLELKVYEVGRLCQTAASKWL